MNAFLAIQPFHWGVGLLLLVVLWAWGDEQALYAGRDRTFWAATFLVGALLYAVAFFVWLILRSVTA